MYMLYNRKPQSLNGEGTSGVQDFPSSLRPFVPIVEYSDQVLLADVRRRELPRRRPERPRVKALEVFPDADRLLRVPDAVYRRRHSE